MNIITGYLGATDGEVKINGHDIFKEPEEAKKCIGYLPELPPLYEDMTVKEYLDFVSELKQLEKSLRKRYVEEAMETTGIKDVSGRMIRNLSKGYRQRVGFAQAILGYPEIIILDEPTVGLDPKQIIEIRELIRSLGEKHTVILSSHILTEISAVCDHVFIISKGKLVASDSTDNLVSLMSGAQEIDLLVRADAEQAEELLTSLPEIERVERRKGAGA
jgi:ABC-2 type transport system ATP-binding protein